MAINKANKVNVQGIEITILNENAGEFISLTDMLKAKDGDFFISDWLRNRNTVEFLGVWETVNNPNFNCGEFAKIRSQAGLNSYKISVKEWLAKTNAIGLKATAGRYGGTYAHIDIAFEFGMWISAEFKVYLIKEYKRLQTEENERLNLEWNFQRILAKVNYKIHTDAIKDNIIPKVLDKQQTSLVYANEADVLNMALFGMTAKQWRNTKPSEKRNIRDYATIQQLVVLSNLESINAMLIAQSMPQNERLILMIPTKNSTSNDYKGLVEHISETYNRGFQKASQAVNLVMVTTYWKIGQYIIKLFPLKAKKAKLYYAQNCI